MTFQFLIGTVKRIFLKGSMQDFLMFQFLIGTVKSYSDNSNEEQGVVCFNSL